MSHAPGPWEVTNVAGIFWIKGDGRSIAQIMPIRGGEANAELIATAPDLLETLKDALAELSPLMLAYRAEHADTILGRMRAAIAKAEGREPG